MVLVTITAWNDMSSVSLQILNGYENIDSNIFVKACEITRGHDFKLVKVFILPEDH